MSEQNLYCESLPAAGISVSLSPEEAVHAVRVLRLHTDDHVCLLDGAGQVADAVIEESCRGRRVEVSCRILGIQAAAPPRQRVRLCVAPPRATKQMTHIVRQATELGFWRITPVICEYSVSRPGAGVPEHWRAEARAAIKQSANPFLPRLDEPALFNEVIDQCSETGIFGAIPEHEDAAAEMHSMRGDVNVWIGPEGGFSDNEKQRLLQRGLLPVAIGRWILRVETAVPALAGWLSAKGGLQ